MDPELMPDNLLVDAELTPDVAVDDNDLIAELKRKAQEAEAVAEANRRLEQRYGTNHEAYRVTDKVVNYETGINADDPKGRYELLTFIQQTYEMTISAKEMFSLLMLQARLLKNGMYSRDLLNNLLPGQLQIQSNDLSQYIDLKKASLLQAKVRFDVVPLTANALRSPLSEDQNVEAFNIQSDSLGFRDLPKKDLLRYWLTGINQKQNMRVADSQTIDNILVAGVAFTLVEYETQSLVGTAAAPDDGEINLRVLDPLKVFPDIHAWKPDFSDCTYVYLYERVPVEAIFAKIKSPQVLEQFRTDYNNNAFIPQRSYLEWQRLGYSAPMEQTIPYVCLYRRVWDEQDQRFYVLYSEFIAVGGLAAYVLTDNVVLNIDEIPIAVAKTEINSPTLFNRSLLSRSAAKYMFVELLESILANVALSAANPPLVAGRSTGLTTEEIAQLQVNGMGAGVLIDDKEGAITIGNALMYLKKEAPQAVTQWLEYVRSQLLIDLGVSKLAQGNAQSVQTGQAMSILNANSDKSDKILLEGFGHYKERVAQLMFKLMQANYQSDRQITLINDDPNTDDVFLFAEYHPELFAGLNTDFVIHGELTTKADADEQEAKARELFLNQASLGLDDLISQAEFIESQSGIPNKEAAMLRLAQKQAQVVRKKAEVGFQVLQKHSAVWQVVNEVYQAINETLSQSSDGQGQFIPPFTPLESLPEQLAPQVITNVQQAFIDNPQLSQLVSFDQVPFFLNSEQVSIYLATTLGYNKLSALDQELAMLQQSFDTSQLQATDSLDQQVRGESPTQAQNGARGAQQPQTNQPRQPQGQEAPQPNADAIETGESRLIG